MVRRNNSILGSGGGPVKDIFVRRTTGLQLQCSEGVKCNKMKYLTAILTPFQRLRTSPA
jgi:hypothetical protein